MSNEDQETTMIQKLMSAEEVYLYKVCFFSSIDRSSVVPNERWSYFVLTDSTNEGFGWTPVSTWAFLLAFLAFILTIYELLVARRTGILASH